jgi:pSer/pThr/pTyr-binding forkhead associated (FHA) protein/pimeloyl-ACP methyl ester carboxylesterase
MESTGFFEIHIDDPGQEHALKVEVSASSGKPDEAGAAGSGYSVRLGWIEGTPYLIDLGSANRVLVNTTPIDPYRPVVIQAGDRITIGSTHLTWNARTDADKSSQKPVGAQAPKVTVVLPREASEAPEPSTPAEPALPTAESDELEGRQVADETLLAPKRVPGQGRAETPEPTVLVPKRAAKPPEPEAPEPTLFAPKRAAKPPSMPVGGAVAPDQATQMPDGEAEYKTAWVDMAQLLEMDTGLESVSTTLLRDTQIPHLVVHVPDRTWEVQFAKESMTVGRAEDNDIPIPDESVSHHHALIERQGDDYVIRDTHSRNGVWLGPQRVERHRLRDGDVLSLGRAKLVFKGAFTSDELTLIGTPRIDGKPARRPVVFVPGMMGSELWIGSERLWPDPKTLISNVEVFSLPSDPRIEARGIVNEVVIVPHIIQLRQYSSLGDYLEAGLGYTRGKDLLEFAYDWRHDVRLAAQRLAETIERWQVGAPITIIAHSLGTLVTRYYVERLGGKRFVERLLLMGGPHYGTPGGLAAILSGPGLLPFGMGAERMRAVLATLPSAYQILPIYPCVTDQNGDYVDLLEDKLWLPEHQRPYLRAARSFRRELGTVSSVPTVSIFGYGLKTKLRVKIERRSDGQWHKVDFIEDSAGDQSVPSGSAVLKGSEIHPVLQEHGSLYVDDDVRMRLKVELTRSTTWQRR